MTAKWFMQCSIENNQIQNLNELLERSIHFPVNCQRHSLMTVTVLCLINSIERLTAQAFR